MRHSPLINWLAQLLLGLGLTAVSLQVGLIFGGALWQVAAGCAVVGLAGLAIAARAEWIERRRRLVKRSRATLALPTPWSVKLDKRLGGWTAPLAVIRDDGMRFVVDIQGFKSVTWSSLPREGGTSPHLVTERGKPLWPDPVSSLAKGALAASAAPVLWLPRATETGTFRHPDTNLTVVAGSPHDLNLALQSARRVTANATSSRDSGPQEA